MFKLARKCQGLIFVLFLTVMLVQPSRAVITELDEAVEEKVLSFVSEVLRIDMTKYSVTYDGPGGGYSVRSRYGGDAIEDDLHLSLTSYSGTYYDVNVWGLFLNGFIQWIKVDTPRNSPVSFVDSPTNALEESRNILQRYKGFAEEYGFGTQHIDSALTLLNNVTGASSVDPDLHIFNKLAGFVPSVIYAGNMKQVVTEDTITWIYTDRDIDMPEKSMRIDFGGYNLMFVDTWNLYTVGCFPSFSEDEALRIGWEAAKNYNITLGGKDGPYNAEYEWSNRASIKLDMVPGKGLAPRGFVSNKSRDAMALYPWWFMVFQFSKPIPVGYRSIWGIAVGVWGDTKEITSVGISQGNDYTRVNPYAPTSTPTPTPILTPELSPEDKTKNNSSDPLEGLEGDPTLPTLLSLNNLEGSFDTPTQMEPSATQTEDPTESESSNSLLKMLLIGGIVGTAIALTGAVVIIKKKKVKF